MARPNVAQEVYRSASGFFLFFCEMLSGKEFFLFFQRVCVLGGVHVRFLLEDTTGPRAANTAATEADVKYEFGSVSL